jgi:3-hydroxybutyryl-CoA dehydratase
MSHMPDRQPQLLVVDDTTPSRPLLVGEIMVGDAVEQHFAFDATARAAFAKVANDRAPVHEDERFAHAHGFRGTVIQGLCVSSRFSRLIGMYLPGEYAILETLALKFRHPTYEGQPLVFRAEVTRILPPLKVVKLMLTASSESIFHLTGEAQCLIR